MHSNKYLLLGREPGASMIEMEDINKNDIHAIGN